MAFLKLRLWHPCGTNAITYSPAGITGNPWGEFLIRTVPQVVRKLGEILAPWLRWRGVKASSTASSIWFLAGDASLVLDYMSWTASASSVGVTPRISYPAAVTRSGDSA